MTLVELLVSLAIMGLLALGVGAIVQSIYKMQANVVNKTDANEFIGALGKWLQSSVGCTSSLVGQAAPSATPAGFVVNGYQGYGSNGDPIGNDFRVNNQLVIKSMTVKDKGAVAATIIQGGVSYTRKTAQIAITFEEQTGAAVAAMRTRFIEVPVLISAGIISKCHIDTTIADSCAAMGGIFDAVTNTCKPQTSCQMKGTYINLSCSPSSYGCRYSAAGSNVNPLTKAYSCPTGASPYLTGKFVHTHVVSCGKKCSVTVTNQEDFYVCMQCS